MGASLRIQRQKPITIPAGLSQEKMAVARTVHFFSGYGDLELHLIAKRQNGLEKLFPVLKTAPESILTYLYCNCHSLIPKIPAKNPPITVVTKLTIWVSIYPFVSRVAPKKLSINAPINPEIKAAINIALP